MKVLIQRVSNAKVEINGEVTGEIGPGILLFIGIEKMDTNQQLETMAKKVLAYRIFSDQDDKMNLSVQDIKGGVLVVSQFTLAAQTSKGLRPGFSSAAPPAEAEQRYTLFVEYLKCQCANIQTGAFGADMQVSLTNDGPVTFLLT